MLGVLNLTSLGMIHWVAEMDRLTSKLVSKIHIKPAQDLLRCVKVFPSKTNIVIEPCLCCLGKGY